MRRTNPFKVVFIKVHSSPTYIKTSAILNWLIDGLKGINYLYILNSIYYFS